MTHIFYFFTLFALAWEYKNFTDPYAVKRWADYAKKHMKKENVESRKKAGEEIIESSVVFFFPLNLLYMFWAFVGLFTSQWALFAALYLLSLIKRKDRSATYRRINGFISFCILVFIILNKYHFKLDLWSMLTSM